MSIIECVYGFWLTARFFLCFIAVKHLQLFSSHVYFCIQFHFAKWIASCYWLELLFRAFVSSFMNLSIACSIHIECGVVVTFTMLTPILFSFGFFSLGFRWLFSAFTLPFEPDLITTMEQHLFILHHSNKKSVYIDFHREWQPNCICCEPEKWLQFIVVWKSYSIRLDTLARYSLAKPNHRTESIAADWLTWLL